MPSIDRVRIVLIGIMVGSASCGAPSVMSDKAGASSETVGATQPDATAPVRNMAHVDYMYPYDTLADWVAFADVVVTIRVVEEKVYESDSTMPERVVGRTVTVEVLDVVWSAPNQREKLVSGERVTFHTLGIWEKLNESWRIPIVDSSGIILELGRTYLTPMLVHYDQWSPQAATIYPVGDVVEPQPESTRLPLGIEGLTIAEVAARLAATPVEPAARALIEAVPLDRVAPVVAARERVVEEAGTDAG